MSDLSTAVSVATDPVWAPLRRPCIIAREALLEALKDAAVIHKIKNETHFYALHKAYGDALKPYFSAEEALIPPLAREWLDIFRDDLDRAFKLLIEVPEYKDTPSLSAARKIYKDAQRKSRIDLLNELI